MYFLSYVLTRENFDVASLVNLLSKNGSICLKIQDVRDIFARLENHDCSVFCISYNV